ncbi:hypothetical protein MASR1M107_22160 [Ignavibacteriales bacterium]
MIKDVHYWDYFNSLTQGNKHKCREIVVSLAEEKADIKDIYINLLQKSLYKIGKMWEEGKISIAEEHIATKITEYLVDISLELYQKAAPNGKSILLTGVDKDFHDIGARMVANLFELHGWNTVFLGGNTPKKEVLNMIETTKPEFVGITYSLYINFIRFVELLDCIKSNFPNRKF